MMKHLRGAVGADAHEKLGLSPVMHLHNDGGSRGPGGVAQMWGDRDPEPEMGGRIPGYGSERDGGRGPGVREPSGVDGTQRLRPGDLPWMMDGHSPWGLGRGGDEETRGGRSSPGWVGPFPSNKGDTPGPG